MQQWLSGIVETVLALRQTPEGRTGLIGTALVFMFNGIYVIANKNVVTSLGLLLSIIALTYNFWQDIQRRRENALRRKDLDLGQALTDALNLREADRRLIEGFQADLDHAAEREEQAKLERDRMRFDLAQLSTEFARGRGHLSRSTGGMPLRSTGPLAAMEVLIVEDEREICRALGRILDHYGFRVADAGTVREAIEAIRGRDRFGPLFDFVILDLQLPDGSGLEVLRVIREQRPAPAVIISSGHLDEEVLEEARRQGAAAVLIKPIDLRELLTLLGYPEEAADSAPAPARGPAPASDP